MGNRAYRRARGLVAAPRADVSDAAKVLSELQTTVAAFKEAHAKEMADLRKGLSDVVQTEKVDRINAEVTKLQSFMDELNAKIAAGVLGGNSGDPISPAVAAHAKAFNQFFRRGAEADLRELEVKASLNAASDPDGGYTVTPQIEKEIDRVLGTVSAMRSLARVLPISAAAYKKLVNQGGASGGWVGEKESRPATVTPTLSALEFPAMELYATPYATQSLLDDSAVDIGAWLGDEVSLTFAEMEGAAFISGDGVNKPRGLTSYPKVADANYAWGKIGFIASGVGAALSDATHNGADALIDLQYALKQGYRNNAGWLMNRKTAGVIRKLKTIGDTEVPLWEPSMKVGQPATLLGHPITDDDNMDDIGAGEYPIAFGDYKRGYLIVDRQGIRVLRDPFTNKPFVGFYTTKRVGGGVQNFEAIKFLKIAAS